MEEGRPVEGPASSRVAPSEARIGASDPFDRLLDDQARILVDEKVAEVVESCRTGNAYGAMFTRSGVERAVRGIVSENLMLKHDLRAAQDMLKRTYDLLDRLTERPEFRRMMEEANGRKE